MSLRRLVDQPHASLRSAAEPRHIGFGERFIDEDELLCYHLTLTASPAPASPGDIRAISLGRGLCPLAWCKSQRSTTVSGRVRPGGQGVVADNLTMAVLLNGAMVSSVMYRAL
jgi:hypothetical protein